MRAGRVAGGVRAPRSVGAAAFVAGALAAAACSLAIDLEPLDRGSAGAPSSTTGDAPSGSGTGAGAAGSTTSGGGTSQGGAGGGPCAALGESCRTAGCCEGECSEDEQRCCLGEGTPCNALRTTECCYQCDMARGTCCGPDGCTTQCKQQGGQCGTPMDCCEGLDCTNSVCSCAPDGAGCGTMAHCCGGFCVAGTCRDTCVSAQGQCQTDMDCCSGACTNNFCACSGDFQPCATTQDCCLGADCDEAGYCGF